MFDRYAVYIVLVNWNGWRDTLACLESLLSLLKEDVKIIILDNCSTDNSFNRIREWAREHSIHYNLISETDTISRSKNHNVLTLISLTSNRGFGGANNIGIKFAIDNGANYILLLNNDTIVQGDFLKKMLTYALAIPDAGIIGGHIRQFYDKDKVWFSGGKISYVRGAFYHREDYCTGIRDTDFISGCLMLIPVPVFKKVGLFDERYFLNVEDIDFSTRMKDAGLRLIIACDAIIYHKVSASIGGLDSAKNQYYFHRNRMFFFCKRLIGIKKVLFIVVQIILAIPVWTTIQLLKRNYKAIQGAFLGYLDFVTNNLGESRYF
jgi:GT2 family glycosyltransferase